MSFGNGEVSHSEMGRENSMTCRAKTYGNSFTEEGQKEKMEGSGTLSTAWDQEPLEWGCTPPEECVKPPRGETYGDSFTVEGQGENTEGVVTFSTAGDQYPLEWALRKSVLTHRKENVQARKWEEN